MFIHHDDRTTESNPHLVKREQTIQWVSVSDGVVQTWMAEFIQPVSAAVFATALKLAQLECAFDGPFKTAYEVTVRVF